MSWIDYDSTNGETVVELPFIYYDYDSLYWYSETNQNAGVNMITMLEPESSIYSALKTMSTNDFTISYWARQNSKFVIRERKIHCYISKHRFLILLSVLD